MHKKLYILCFLLGLSSHTFAQSSDQNWKKDDLVYTQIFQREYTPEHLNKNLLQRVSKIFVQLDFISKDAKQARKNLGADFDDDQNKILMSIYVKYLDRRNWYQQEAICHQITTKDDYICHANITDGGQFLLHFNSKDQILMDFSTKQNMPILEECVDGAWENAQGQVSLLTNKDGEGEKFILYRKHVSLHQKIPKNCFDF